MVYFFSRWVLTGDERRWYRNRTVEELEIVYVIDLQRLNNLAFFWALVMPMLGNYLKIAWRHVTRQKVYTAINVVGLSIGLCACIVIYTVIDHEFSFDGFHPDKERIYRVVGDVRARTGESLHFVALPASLPAAARAEVSGMEAIGGVIPYKASIHIPDGDQPGKEFRSESEEVSYPSTVIAEQAYLDVFHYDWLAGNAATALKRPFAVVLTESRGRQYFGAVAFDRMIGRQVVYGDSLQVQVSGIVRDWDAHTDLAFTDLISFPTIRSSVLKSSVASESWQMQDKAIWTFAKLSKGTAVGQVNRQLAAVFAKHADAQNTMMPWLQPLSDMHFNPGMTENPIRTAHMPTLYGLQGIALFVMLLAIINFINLSTAQSIRRAREVGIRKVMGGSRMGLVFQFLTETVVVTLFSVILGVLFVKPVLSAGSSFLPPGVRFHFFQPSSLLFLFLITLVTSLLAGLYPARVLSAYLPALILKGGGAEKGGEKWLLRKGLIVFQFTVSLVFIIGSLVIARQLEYMQQKDLGFKADAIVSVETPRGDSLRKIKVLAQMIRQLPGVREVALQWVPPMSGNGRGHGIRFARTDKQETDVTQVCGDEAFIPLYELKLMAGRGLAPADSLKEFVINERLSRMMGCKAPEDAIGKMLYWNDQPYPVVGVVADFHSRSLHDPITPVCIVHRPEREGTLAIKLTSAGGIADGVSGRSGSSENIRATLAGMEGAWQKIYPGGTFNYGFYDETLVQIYDKDRQTGRLMNGAMCITIFISCIGLFGLALFTAEKRSKEISIRKVLGAGVADISAMLFKDFVLLIVIAFFIASPIAWYCMHQWLQGFAYRIGISWWIFVSAGFGAIVIALITIGSQSVKAAIANPVKGLRAE